MDKEASRQRTMIPRQDYTNAICSIPDLGKAPEDARRFVSAPGVDSLGDLTRTGSFKQITFGARNKAKLSAAQLALVTDKGWVLG